MAVWLCFSLAWGLMDREEYREYVSQPVMCVLPSCSSVISVKQKSRQKTGKDRELDWAIDSFLDVIMTYPCILFFLKPPVTIVWNG